MLPKAHLNLHSRISGSRLVITASWLSGSWRAFLQSSSVYSCHFWASLVAQLVKNLPAMWETWVWSLGWEDPLEEGKATLSFGVPKSWTQLSDFLALNRWGNTYMDMVSQWWILTLQWDCKHPKGRSPTSIFRHYVTTQKLIRAIWLKLNRAISNVWPSPQKCVLYFIFSLFILYWACATSFKYEFVFVWCQNCSCNKWSQN